MNYFFNKRSIGNVKLFVNTGGERCEISTGVKIDGGNLHSTRGYLDDTREAGHANNLMFAALDKAQEKIDLYKRENDGASPSAKELKDLYNEKKIIPTLHQVIANYRDGMANSRILKSNGHASSSFTRRTAISATKTMLIALSKELLYTKLSASSLGTPEKAKNLSVRIIKRLSKFNYEDKSIYSYLGHLKEALKYYDECFGTRISVNRSEFKISVKEKKVNLITKGESDYVINNFDSIRLACENLNEVIVADLWLCALLLGQRSSDMQSWTTENLETRGDATWISFRQSKGDKPMSLPVHPKLLEVFMRNSVLHGGSLIPKTNNVTLHLKNIAKRLSIFDYDFKKEVWVGGKLYYKTGKRWEFLTLHEMRGTCITNMIESGVDTTIVKSFSGHSGNSKSFSRYVDVRDKSKEDALSKLMGNVACDNQGSATIRNLNAM